MKKLISHKWYAGGVKEYDTETGRITGSSDAKWGTTGFGSLWHQNGKTFAFHRDDQSLLLQCGKLKWRVTKDYRVSLRKLLFIRNFRIWHDGKWVFSIWYIPSGLIFGLVDPTYDAIDAESDDFFLYLRNMWAWWGERP